MPTPTPASLGSNGPVSSRAGDVYFSSGAETFLAFMQILKAQQEGMNNMATLAETTTMARATIIGNVASATEATYNDDADNLRLQGGEQIGSAVVGALQGATAIGGMFAAQGASKFARQMDDLTKQVNDMPAKPSGLTVGDAFSGEANPGVIGPKSAKQLTIEKYTDEMNNKTFDYTKVAGKGGLDAPLENGVTMREVLESAKTKEAGDQLKTRIGSHRKLAVKQESSKQSFIQQMGQLVNSGVQAIGGTNSAVMKGKEADTQAKKGLDSVNQQYSQAASQFAQETNSSQVKQAEQYAQNMQQTWQSVHEIVQVDTKG